LLCAADWLRRCAAPRVESWLGKVRGDKRMVVTAAAQAQRAADYILNVRGHDDDAAQS
jgi:antirestriction protein ArdC